MTTSGHGKHERSIVPCICYNMGIEHLLQYRSIVYNQDRLSLGQWGFSIILIDSSIREKDRRIVDVNLNPILTTCDNDIIEAQTSYLTIRYSRPLVFFK